MRRDRLTIYYCILKSSTNAIGFTRLMYSIGLAYVKTKCVIKFLVSKGMLEECVSNEKCKLGVARRYIISVNPKIVTRRKYKTTEKGKSFIKSFDEILEMLK